MVGMTVVLAAGDFPRRGGRAWELLSAARRVVACDSAAVGFHRHFGRWPEVVVGDLDSIPQSVIATIPERIVHVADQDTNDLTKALDYCRSNGWHNPIVVGGFGKREDHAIGNVFRAFAASVRMVTDHGVFYPVEGKIALKVKRGTPISVFATDPSTHAISDGLEWPLDRVRFANLYCATLNRASKSMVKVESDRPLLVFVAER